MPMRMTGVHIYSAELRANHQTETQHNFIKVHYGAQKRDGENLDTQLGGADNS